MDYEKKYKEALERAKMINNGEDVDVEAGTTTCEYIFPELAESEDEKMREELIRSFKSLNTIEIWNGIKRSDILAWLEKQGQKPTTIDIDKMVNDYANNKERGNEEFGKPVNCMIRAYRQGLNDAIGKVVLKHSWSEEDELMLLSIIQSLETTNGAAQMKIDWLKTIKQRIGE